MTQFLYKRWVKICAAILSILSFNFMAGAFFVMLAGDAVNTYNRSEADIWEEAKDGICNKYSVRAAVNFKNDFGMELLGDTNFRYGVIQAESLDGLDLNNRSIYKICNFDKKVTEDMLYIHTYSLGDATNFQVGTSLFDSYSVYNESECRTDKKNIEDVFYAWDTDSFFCVADGAVYPLTSFVECYFDVQERIASYESDGETIYFWKDTKDNSVEDPNLERVFLNGQIWNLSDILIASQKDIPGMGRMVSDNEGEENFEEFFVQDGYIFTNIYDLGDTEPYYVLSYVNEPLDTEGGFFNQNVFGKLENWRKQDFFVQANYLIHLFFSLRYAAFGIVLVSGILFFLSLGFLLAAAGHKNSKEITGEWLEKIPYDIFLIGMAGIYTLLLGTAAYCIRYMNIWIAVWYGVLVGLAAEILALLCCMDAAVRLKLGKWWKNTICWRICAKALHLVRSIAEKLNRAAPLLWRAWIVMLVLAIFEFVGLCSTTYHRNVQIFLWFLEKLVLYGFLTLCLLQMKKLQQEGERLASGDMESRLDTRHMFWDLKKHGNNLNNIREGIRCAVAEQLKSERFQTELITNVSHDIKTPLTSIINYVDLLEKKEADNPAVQEYLEVLSRQSTRLKKLIEDLIEASKASAGSLAVAWEDCDAQVMLTQTIGEFEEKLKANQIELIVQSNTEEAVISADPRHLWRIFDNLMNNICKYAQPSTRAYVNIEKKKQSEQIIFRNISKYALNIDSDELMKRFVRGDSSRNTEGNGLGLSIAKSLTELMQGEFELVVDGDLFKVILTFPVMEQDS